MIDLLATNAAIHASAYADEIRDLLTSNDRNAPRKLAVWSASILRPIVPWGRR